MFVRGSCQKDEWLAVMLYVMLNLGEFIHICRQCVEHGVHRTKNHIHFFYESGQKSEREE